MRDAAVLYGVHGLRFVAPLLLYPVLTRRWGVEAFGLYVAAVSMAAVTAVVVDYGASIAGPRDVAGAADEAGAVAGATVALRLALTPVALSCGFGLAWLNPVLHGAWLPVSAGLALGLAQGGSLLWFFQGLRDPAPAALAEIGGLLTAAVIILVIPTLSVGGALAVQAAGLGGGVAVCARLASRRCRLIWPSLGVLRRRLREGAPLFFSQAAVVAYTGAGVLFVAALAGPGQAALYAVADKLTAAAGSLLRPMAGLISPRLAVLLIHKPEAAFRTARWSLRVTPILFAAVSGAIWFAAPIATRLAAGADYQSAAEVLRRLVFILPLVATSQVLGLQLMTALRMDRGFAVMVSSGLLATSISALVLVPAGGAAAMATARLIGEAVVILTSLICLRPHWQALFWPDRRLNAPAI